jgi:hypothetical protein
MDTDDKHLIKQVAGTIVLVVAGLVWLAQYMPEAKNQHPANEAYLTMVAQTGCESKFSDQKKADLFAENYLGKPMTVSGQVTTIGKDWLGIKIDPKTLTFDVSVFVDPSVAYAAQKDSRVTVTFTPSMQGGCILPYDGKNGVLN